MHWSLSLILSATVLVTAAPLLEEREAEPVPNCPKEVAQHWVNQKPSWAGEDPKGKEFCMTKWQGGFRISEIKGWYEDNGGTCAEGTKDNRGALQRIEVTFTNGEKTAIGKKDPLCYAGIIGLTDVDVVDSVTSYAAINNPKGQGMLGFAWREADHPDSRHNAQLDFSPLIFAAKPWQPTTGGGILIGLIGHIDGEVITSITPIFTPSPIKKTVRKNSHYDPNDLSRVNIKTTELASAVIYNDRGVDDQFKFQANPIRTATFTKGKSSKLIVGGSVEYERTFKVPLVSESKLKGTFEIKGEWEWMSTDAQTTTHAYIIEQSGPLAAGKAVKCTAITGEANGDFNLDTDVTYFYEDGTTWSFSERTTLTGTGITALQHQVTCSDYGGDVTAANVVKLSSMHP